jgi:hypothetical protein
VLPPARFTDSSRARRALVGLAAWLANLELQKSCSASSASRWLSSARRQQGQQVQREEHGIVL